MKAFPRPHCSAPLIGTSESRGPGSDSTVTPGFRTAGFATCITFNCTRYNMHPMKKHFALTLAALVMLVSAPMAQEKIDKDMQWKIRKEEMENSQIMRTMHFLTDVYGPRLTGSPNLKAAGEWAIKQMQTWGFVNGHLEPWDFGHPGWLNERFSAHITSPIKDQLTCEVLAWTPSTEGTVTAQAYQIVLPEKPTQEILTAYLDSQKEKVKGKVVLVGKHQFVPVTV